MTSSRIYIYIEYVWFELMHDKLTRIGREWNEQSSAASERRNMIFFCSDEMN